MPCYDPRSDMDAKEQREALDLATDLLCRECKQYEAQGRAHEMPANLAKWWEEHQKLDAARG